MTAAWLFLSVVSLLPASTLNQDSIVRSGCDSDEREIAKLAAGQAVDVRSRLSGSGGTCFKIVARVEGREVVGYVPAKSVADTDGFDQARRGAANLDRVQAASEVRSLAAAAASRTGNKEHPATRAWELIDANQPTEALRMLEGDLKRYPQDPYLLAVAGYAYYKTDDLDRAIMHWKESIDLQPNPSIRNLLQRAEKERGADKGSERMVGTRVVLRHERGTVNSGLARAMLAVLDEEYTRVSFQLGCRASEKLMAIVQSRETYLRSTSAAEWSGGQYDGRIHIPVSDSESVSVRQRQIFAHELVHACLSELGRWPAWVQEGLAQKYSGEVLSAQRRTVVEEMIQAKSLPRLSALGATFSRMNSQNAGVAYGYAYVAAEKLLQLHANTGIGYLLRNPAELGRYTEQVEKALGF